jgi:hypothetical protein
LISLREIVVYEEAISPELSLQERNQSFTPCHCEEQFFATKQSRLNKGRNTTNKEKTLIDLDCFVPRNDSNDGTISS